MSKKAYLASQQGGGAAGGGVSYADVELAVSNALMLFLPEFANAVPVPAGLGTAEGEVRLFNTPDGLPPLGWTKVSGYYAVPPYGQLRLVMTNGLTTWTANNNSTLLLLSGTAGGSKTWDIGTGITTTIANHPLTAASHQLNKSAAILASLYAYQFGQGSSSTRVVNKGLYRYDTANNVWASRANIPATVGAIFQSVAPLASGRILLVGGTNDGFELSASTMLAGVGIYDPTANAWETKANAPCKSAEGKSCLRSNGNVFFIFKPSRTTTDATGTVLNTNTRAFDYNPTTDVWTELDNPPVFGQPYETSDGRVAVVSGALNTSVACNLAASAGTQWQAYGFTQPSGWTASQTLTSTDNGPAFTALMGGNAFLPVGFSTHSYILTVLNYTPASEGAFYAKKD